MVTARQAAQAGIRAEMQAAGRLPKKAKKVQTVIICQQCHVGAWHMDIDEHGVCKFCRG